MDGGGIRGAFSSAVLASIEAQFGVHLLDHFDLITGTSTGGIIALALAAGLPASEIREFYRTQGPKIFAPLRGPRRSLRLLSSVVRPKHSQAPLRESLQAVFGDRTMGSLGTRVVIPTFNANSGEIRLFKTPHHLRLTRDHTRSLVEVALATSAAPYFLPGLTTAEGERFIDGGVWANNPIAVGVIEAIGYLGVPAPSIRVLSVGTTCEPFHVDANVVRRGVLGLVLGAARGQSVGLFMASQMAGAHAMAKVLLGREDAILRLDQAVARGRFAMDRADDIEELVGLAEHVATHAAPAVRELFLAAPGAFPFKGPSSA
ncbi:MAG: patatin-like phospholipase family protein [Gemmatimonadales bacterium]|nr:patatin-like phospholipase family protein [Gemmatimonadales bacterium]